MGSPITRKLSLYWCMTLKSAFITLDFDSNKKSLVIQAIYCSQLLLCISAWSIYTSNSYRYAYYNRIFNIHYVQMHPLNNPVISEAARSDLRCLSGSRRTGETWQKCSGLSRQRLELCPSCSGGVWTAGESLPINILLGAWPLQLLPTKRIDASVQSGCGKMPQPSWLDLPPPPDCMHIHMCVYLCISTNIMLMIKIKYCIQSVSAWYPLYMYH